MRTLTAAACAYEIVALITDRVPTITTLMRKLRDTPGGRQFVWLALGFVSWHFLVDD